MEGSHTVHRVRHPYGVGGWMMCSIQEKLPIVVVEPCQFLGTPRTGVLMRFSPSYLLKWGKRLPVCQLKVAAQGQDQLCCSRKWCCPQKKAAPCADGGSQLKSERQEQDSAECTKPQPCEDPVGKKDTMGSGRGQWHDQWCGCLTPFVISDRTLEGIRRVRRRQAGTDTIASRGIEC